MTFLKSIMNWGASVQIREPLMDISHWNLKADVGQRRPQRLPGHYILISFFLVTQQKWLRRPSYCWRYPGLWLYDIEKSIWNCAGSFLSDGQFSCARWCREALGRPRRQALFQVWTLWSTVLTCKARCAHWFNSCATVVCYANNWPPLIGFPSARGNPYLAL